MALDAYERGSALDYAYIDKVKEGCDGQLGINGWMYATAEGKVLAPRGDFWGPFNLSAALEAFRKLPESERKPKIEKPSKEDLEGGSVPPSPPPGGLIARAYTTHLERNEKGELVRARNYRPFNDPKEWVIEPGLTWHEHFWMTEEEWRSLVPKNAKKGDTFPAPAFLKQRLFWWYVGIQAVEGCADYWRGPREGDLAFTVEEASAAGVRLRLEGYVKAGKEFSKDEVRDWGAEFRYLGFLNYDAQKKAFDRFDIVQIGEVWGGKLDDPGDVITPNTIRWGHARWPLGIAFELVSGDKPADRIPPYYAARRYENRYFEPRLHWRGKDGWGKE